MTSKFTREELLNIIETDHVQCGEASALARMALAAMDSEPVAYISKSDFDAGYPHILARRDFNKACTMAVYAAQPAPVVPELRVDWQENEFSAGWNACRAAMLNHPEQHLDMVDHYGDVNEKGGDGNFPVIPDGWTCNDKANAALMMLDRIETADPVDDDRIDGIKRIVRELAAAPHDTHALNSVQSVVTVPGKWIPVSEQKPDCWCLTCRPVTLNDMRFVVCPDCGNKRCPRANDHRNACTGSNEPGQEGSAYPDTTQEPKP